MNEFEALKRLRQETCPATYMPDFNKEECLEVIEKALLELKAIKEAKPSEALGNIGILAAELGTSKDTKFAETRFPKMLATIKDTLLKVQKLEKAWEVAKDHLVFEDRGIETYPNKTKYLIRIESKDTGATIHIHLDTQEEADLLKEMLE